jgi:3-methylcrotonyl-CoA carboxylase beta subunit
MPILQTQLNARSNDFKANVAAMDKVVADLRATVATIALGGPEAARQKHLARGKLLPRERVNALIDPGSAVPRTVATRRLRHVWRGTLHSKCRRRR